MHKKILSFALAISLIGNSYAGADSAQPKSEQQKIVLFHTLLNEALKNNPEPSFTTKALVGAVLGAIGCPTLSIAGFLVNGSTLLPSQKWPKSVVETEAVLFAALPGALAFLGYEACKQFFTKRNLRKIIEQIVAHYAAHPEDLPAQSSDQIVALIAHYQEHKELPANINPAEVCIALKTIGYTNTYKQALADAESKIMNKPLKYAALFGAAAGPIASLGGIIGIFKLRRQAALTQILTLLAISGTPCIAIYEKWLQYRETKKTHLIIEHLVKHFAEHQDELNDDQIAVFAPLIAEFNEKKSLDINNQKETLAQLQAVL